MGGNDRAECEWGELLMSNYLVDGADLTSVANAIRAKSGGSSQLAFPGGFVSEIGNIPSGGGGAKTESGTFTVASGYITSKSITHSLNTTRLFGMIWLEPDANDQVIAPNGYTLIFGHFITFDFPNALYEGTEVVQNYTSDATKTMAYPLNSTSFLRRYRSTWVNKAAGWGNSDTGSSIQSVWGAAISDSEFSINTTANNTYMCQGTYHWQVWALDDWVGG